MITHSSEFSNPVDDKIRYSYTSKEAVLILCVIIIVIIISSQ